MSFTIPNRGEVWCVPGDEKTLRRVASTREDGSVWTEMFGASGVYYCCPGTWDSYLGRGAVRIWPPEKKYEQALEQSAAVLQAALPAGQGKHIGLLEVPAGVEELFHQNALLATTVGVAKSVLDDIREKVGLVRDELAALVPNPSEPDWMLALGNSNQADAACLDRAYSGLAEVLEMFDLVGEAADDDVGDGG